MKRSSSEDFVFIDSTETRVDSHLSNEQYIDSTFDSNIGSNNGLNISSDSLPTHTSIASQVQTFTNWVKSIDTSSIQVPESINSLRDSIQHSWEKISFEPISLNRPGCPITTIRNFQDIRKDIRKDIETRLSPIQLIPSYQDKAIDKLKHTTGELSTTLELSENFCVNIENASILPLSAQQLCQTKDRNNGHDDEHNNNTNSNLLVLSNPLCLEDDEQFELANIPSILRESLLEYIAGFQFIADIFI